jgi:hypothetical protein
VARREKRLTKRERKELNPAQRHTHAHDGQHIHCIACGRHLDPEGFEKSPPDALFVRCQHGSDFPCCVGCEVEAKHRLAEHDKSGKPVQVAKAWH